MTQVSFFVAGERRARGAAGFVRHARVRPGAGAGATFERTGGTG